MDMGRFLIETHLRTRRPIKELAAAHDVSASWLFKLLCRYRLEGPVGLEPHSRRPKHSPSRIADRFEDEIVALHKALAGDGLDAGAQTVHYHLSQRHPHPPSVTTVFRVLKARGFVTLQPQKRPKSSLHRFCADLPNETWQADMTHVELHSGEVFEVLNMIDDHSRLCVASRAMVTVKAPDVVRVLHHAAETWGYPASFLSDNGLIFSTQRRHQVAGATEQALFALGIEAKHSRPYHPQTCGKVERFHQTMKKFLAAQEGVVTKKQLQRSLDRFVAYYNEVRPHRGIGRRTPAAAFGAREKAGPSPSFVPLGHRRLRIDRVDKSGRVTLRHRGRLHHIGIGNAYAGWRVAMLIEGQDIEIVGLDGSPLRRLVLDLNVDYQRIP
ncbi:MAG: integrase core domain-containing protein [Acidimicrobiales bacterium]